MSRFSVKFQRTMSTTLSVGTLLAAASNPRRMKVYEFAMGSEATPADLAFLVHLRRVTAVGSQTGGASVTPYPLDPADPIASIAVATQANTTDPTITSGADTLTRAMNQRATIQWQAAPDSEIVIPATASNGLAILTPGAPASVGTASILYNEI